MKWLNRKESWMRKKQRKKFVCTDGREKSINEVDIWWLNISGRTSPEETKENMCKRWWGGRQRKRKEGDYINFVVVSGARCQQSEFSWYEQFGHHNTIATSICEIRRNSASWKCIGRREGPLVLYCWPFDPEELSDCSIFPSRYQFFTYGVVLQLQFGSTIVRAVGCFDLCGYVIPLSADALTITYMW